MPVARAAYPSDVTDRQWAVIQPLLPQPKTGGRPHTTDMREVADAVFYVLRTGSAWRQLPHDFPPWSTVYDYFRRFRNDGVWQQIHDSLREKVRVKAGREPTPSAAIVDSQSVKTTEKGDPRPSPSAGRAAGRAARGPYW